jgi:hypothetical protein
VAWNVSALPLFLDRHHLNPQIYIQQINKISLLSLKKDERNQIIVFIMSDIVDPKAST